MDRLTERQLALLGGMGELDPPPCVMGGYAEDALLAGSVTRPHGDVDWLVPRDELGVRVAQARSLGFSRFETWGEAAPGVPFYLYAKQGDLALEVGVSDEADGAPLLRVHSVAFDIDGKPPTVGYQLWLPRDTFAWPPARIDGVTIHVASPLALYQLRVGISRYGSFGVLTERQLDTSRKLRERFFPDRPEAELVPRSEPLP